MKSKIFALSLALLIVPTLLSGCKQPRKLSRSQIKRGEAKAELVKNFGEPVQKDAIVKSSAPVSGPAEGFWEEIPMGARLEVWKYGFPDGMLELYFLNDDDKVGFIAFTPKGVVYEKSGK